MVIKLGIIGLSADQRAWATMTHIGPLKKEPLSEQYKLTAVATSSLETAKAAGQAQGLPESKAYSKPEDIANDTDVDMVTVSVKVPMHYKLAMPALKAKKDVFVEWPLGANTAEAEEMAALAKQQGVKTAVGLQARLSPMIQKAKEIIESGALGRIVSTTLVGTMSALQSMPEKASYFNDPKSGANFVSIPVSHVIDPFCYLLGEFKWLSASLEQKFPTVQFLKSDGNPGSPVKSNIKDALAVHGVLESGASASFAYNATTTATPDNLNWVISGEKGSLKFESDNAAIQMAATKLLMYKMPETPAAGIYEEKKPAEWVEVEVAPFIAFGGIGEVYQAVAEGRPGLVDFEEAVKRHHMVDAIFRSAEKGTRETY
ncbi:MAG: hypothetical protein Q9164_002122 [Protoblastenia rupestris]